MSWHFKGFPHEISDDGDANGNESLNELLKQWFLAYEELQDGAGNDLLSFSHDITSEALTSPSGSRDRKLYDAYQNAREWIGSALEDTQGFTARQKIRYYYITGLLASALGRWGEAFELFELSAKHLSGQGRSDPSAQAIIGYQGGNAALHAHHYRRATDHFQRVLTLRSELGLPNTRALVSENLDSFLCHTALLSARAHFNLGHITEARKAGFQGLASLSHWIESRSTGPIAAHSLGDEMIYLSIDAVPAEAFEKESDSAWRQLVVLAPWEYACDVLWEMKLFSDRRSEDVRAQSYEVITAGIKNFKRKSDLYPQVLHHLYFSAVEIAFAGYEFAFSPSANSSAVQGDTAGRQRDLSSLSPADWLVRVHNDMIAANRSLNKGDEPMKDRHKLFMELSGHELAFRSSELLRRSEDYNVTLEDVRKLEREAFEQGHLHISGRSNRLLGHISVAKGDRDAAQEHYQAARDNFDADSNGVRYSPYHDEMKRELLRLPQP